MNKKILLVSDRSKFSTKDVYVGYCNALTDLDVNSQHTSSHGYMSLYPPVTHFDYYPLHDYLSLYSADTCFCQIIAKALIPENRITHVLFISGIEIPCYVYETLDTHGIKVGVIATDDPHSSMPIYEDRKKYLKYWFSNEKTLAHSGNTICHYLPMAASNHVPLFDKGEVPEKYKSDVLFIGSAYPNRIPYLEVAARWCKSAGKRFVFAGITSYVAPDSVLNECKVCGPIDNQETLKYLQGAKCTINISRDIAWHPYLPYNARLWHTTPYSANPRMYEAAICKCLQVVYDDRPEYREWLGDDAVYFQEKSDLVNAIRYICEDMEDASRDTIVNRVYDKVLSEGCYIHRAMKMLSIIRTVDNKEVNDKMDKDFQAI